MSPGFLASVSIPDRVLGFFRLGIYFDFSNLQNVSIPDRVLGFFRRDTINLQIYAAFDTFQSLIGF